MGMDAHCVRILFRRKMRVLRSKTTKEIHAGAADVVGLQFLDKN